jgi:cyclophilin family peptidyl-prolyl cis-trans isomerase
MEMPHAIDHFLRMVEKKLWDGLALVHEANSKLVMATPTTMDDSHTWAGQRFVDANLTHMAFTEYSQTFPPPHHRKFSVAFSGRPGGPNFYINLDDESEFAHEHESTFGVVLEGRDVLMKLLLQKMGREQSTKMLTIEGMEILESKSEG